MTEQKLSLKKQLYLFLFHCTLDCKTCGFGKIEYDSEKGYYRERCYKVENKPIWGSKIK